EDDAKFIYPPRIEMSPYDCDIWVTEQITNLQNDKRYDEYFFDKVIYWKLVTAWNVTIERDRNWFAENLSKFEQMWNYVIFLRTNKDKLEIFENYINSQMKKSNKDIMNVMAKLY